MGTLPGERDDPIFKKAVSDKGDDSINLSIALFQPQPLAAKRRIIRKALLSVHGNLRRIRLSHVDAVIQLADNESESGELDLPNQIKVIKSASAIALFLDHNEALRKKNIESKPAFQYELTQPGKVYIKETGFSFSIEEIGLKDLPEFDQGNPNIAFFDKERLSFPLCIRNPRPGDRFSPLGLKGTQKLKKFFIDHKVSSYDRARCPILLSQNKIVWVSGHRLDNFAKIRSDTKKVFKASLSLA